MFSTVALISSGAVVAERVSYDSYGQARHHRGGDVNGDGASDGSDLAIVFGLWGKEIGDAEYRAEADLNHDCIINGGDYTLLLGTWGTALPAGLISNAGTGGPDNAIGWDGYVFNPATGDYLVRNRTYDPALGRWRQRDPALYADSWNLYENVKSSPISFIDPTGLVLVAIDGTCSKDFRTNDPAYRTPGGACCSHVQNFHDDYSGIKKYFDGPDSWLPGNAAIECGNIEFSVLEYLRRVLCCNPNEPVDLVGHSRGGHIAMEIARRLGRDGIDCPNGCKLKNINVRFLGVYDPVAMSNDYGPSDTIPRNVLNSVRILAAGTALECGHKGDSGTGRSRPGFNRVDGPAESRATRHRDCWVFATHSALGGAPWCGDAPAGHSRGGDRAGAVRADTCVREGAKAAGVPISCKAPSDYQYENYKGSLPW